MNRDNVIPAANQPDAPQNTEASSATPGAPARLDGSPSRILNIVALLKRDQFGWFLLAAAGIFLLAPRFLLLGEFVLEQVLEGSADPPELDTWPYVPATLPVAVAVAYLTFFAKRRVRLAALVSLILPLAWVYGRLDSSSILPLSIFLLTAFAVIRLPTPRLITALLLTAVNAAALFAVHRLLPGNRLTIVLSLFPVLIPMLWYSVYEHGRRSLSLKRFLAYMSTRLFSSPVITYGDLFTPPAESNLTATRWAGIRAIYVALLASIVGEAWERVAGRIPIDTLSGLPLLFMSYFQYLAFCCAIVVRFNLFIGVMRLFGVPIRDNFKYWLLARTPNEHWQRWNLLAREWMLTFVFFPIMRSRRWLFVAVMASLLTGSVLHQLPLILTSGFQAPRLAASLFYWGGNGLAIYTALKIPQLFPGLPERLRMPGSRTWSVIGIILTSAFYSILHGIRTESGSWAEIGNYVSRLVGGVSP